MEETYYANDMIFALTCNILCLRNRVVNQMSTNMWLLTVRAKSRVASI